MTGYAKYAPHYLAAGFSPLPLPHGRKVPPPDGFTGYAGPMATQADVAAWAAQAPEANIALRLPPTVVGIDWDAYKPDGVATMDELNARLGDLPMLSTWRSSSRNDGSGIFFFRLPEGLPRIGDVGKGIETIRFGHRYAVVAPSLHPQGGSYRWYSPDGGHRAPRVDDLPMLPQAWIEHLVERGERKMDARAAMENAPTVTWDALDEAERRRVEAFVTASLEGIRSDLEESAAWAVGQTDSRGRGWEKLQADKAIRLASLALADWNDYGLAQAQADFEAWAPTGAGWTAYDVSAKFVAQSRRATPAPFPPDAPSSPGAALMAAYEPTPGGSPQSAVPSSQALVSGFLETVDVTNDAQAVEWLRENLGRGALSGIFLRGSDLVFTPRIGQEGYIEPRAGQASDSASITVLDAASLAARVQSRYRVVAIKNKATIPALFPMASTLQAVKAPDDMDGLRQLRGVVHSPTFRSDGSLISRPGYDATSEVLFLPTGGQPRGAIPARPSAQDVATARQWIDFMLQDFRFVSDDDRANYIGLLLTPLLRNIVPPPYKLGVIEAHQPGSGKSFLAHTLMTTHSGVWHAEMPSEEPEVNKTISSILDVTTGAVVVFDNVSGVVRSSTLTGVLSSDTYQGRRLGTSKQVEAPNDRLWVMTGNNAVLAGDLARRSLRVMIDPGVPNPETRTGFAISDFKSWVREHRGDLLWSLIVLVQAWVQQGSPVPDRVRGDDYGRWSAVVGSILATSGIPGRFDDPLRSHSVDPEVEEWSGFLRAAYDVFESRPWTAKQLLAQVAPPSELLPVGAPRPPIPFDALPDSLVDGKLVTATTTLSRRLGKFLQFRQGRWFGTDDGALSVVRQPGGSDSHGVRWVLRRHGVDAE